MAETATLETDSMLHASSSLSGWHAFTPRCVALLLLFCLFDFLAHLGGISVLFLFFIVGIVGSYRIVGVQMTGTKILQGH